MIKNRKPTEEQIARLAYELYLNRGCEPGRDVEDWIAATNQLSGPPSGDPKTAASEHEAAAHHADLRSAWPEGIA